MVNQFVISKRVMQAIEDKILDPEHEMVVKRCVWGYSESQNLKDRMAKVKYRILQCCKADKDCDWTRSVKILDTKKIELFKVSGNSEVDQTFDVNLYPWVLNNYLSRESGNNVLIQLIQENNQDLVNLAKIKVGG